MEAVAIDAKIKSLQAEIKTLRAEKEKLGRKKPGWFFIMGDKNWTQEQLEEAVNRCLCEK